MNPEEYRFLSDLEEHHWWFVGMRKILSALLGRFELPAPLRVLDAGCGTGFMLAWLRDYGKGSQAFGLDPSPDAIHFSRLRGEKLLTRGSVLALPYASKTFDLVTCLDVLDRFPIDEGLPGFAELARILKGGGRMLVRVPAFQFLYSKHDQAVFTVHRYTAAELTRSLVASGMIPETVTYANTVLFPGAVLWRLWQRASWGRRRSDVRELPRGLRWTSPALQFMLGLEAAWLRSGRRRLPFGLSVIAVARKPESSS